MSLIYFFFHCVMVFIMPKHWKWEEFNNKYNSDLFICTNIINLDCDYGLN